MLSMSIVYRPNLKFINQRSINSNEKKILTVKFVTVLTA